MAPAFLGAGLLFVIEPMLAKRLLPWLGGNPATWSACLLSFQILLLAGYAYAYWVPRNYSLYTQALLHMILLVSAALAALGLEAIERPEWVVRSPLWAVPGFIVSRVGLPYVVLASTTPLLAHWQVGTARVAAKPTPSLYALSNAGALLGLVAYPFLIEPSSGVEEQLEAWAWAFVAFAVTMLPACASALRAGGRAGRMFERLSPLSIAVALRWLALSFVPSALLLAATNHITVDIAATPLLWALPLALYLLSFVVAFGPWRDGFRGPALLLWSAGALVLGANAYMQSAASLGAQVGGTLLALFSCCLLCHGELGLGRPVGAELGRFYLILASGGALGGVFVALVAPWAFGDYYELEISAMAAFVVLYWSARTSAREQWSRAQRRVLFLGSGACLPLLAASLWVRLQPDARDGHVVERRRSFLGALRVVDVPNGRVLTHGRIQHGMQLSDPALRRTPTMYFGQGTALERALRGFRVDRARRIGVIGLGVGTIAAYGRAGDELRFYELDANVIDVARRDFTFLADSAAHVELVLGDGRLSLAREPPRHFDILILDAFSSDSVPVHLLTREAFAVYLKHLSPGGLLLANVSNRYLAVDRVVRASARAHGLGCDVVLTPTSDARHVSRVEWALATSDAAELAALAGAARRGTLSSARGPEVPWTDTRASVFSILR